jgi:hypothetical protein
MNIKKYILRRDTFRKKKLKSYSFFQKNSYEACLIGEFLTDSYNGKFTREWFNDETSEGLATNMITVLKRGNNMVFFNVYEEEIYEKSTFNEAALKYTLTITKDVFLKMLDQWEKAKSELKKFIVIEITPDNDVTITAFDELTEEDRLMCESQPRYYA